MIRSGGFSVSSSMIFWKSSIDILPMDRAERLKSVLGQNMHFPLHPVWVWICRRGGMIIIKHLKKGSGE